MHVNKFLLLVVLWLVACTEEKSIVRSVEKISEDTVKINDSQHLQIEQVEEKKFPIEVEFNGRVTVPEKDLFSISSRVSGRIESIKTSVGDRVDKGQVVGTVWSADLVSASEEYEIAKKEGGRLFELTQQKLNSLGVGSADLKSGRTVFSLYSPVGGVVLEKKLNAGSAVNPGDIILVVGKMGTLQFVGDFPPEIAIKIKKGMKVLFDEDDKLEAFIESVSPIADPATHLVKVRAIFNKQPSQSIPQESFLKAHIVLNEIPALVFPAKSLIAMSDGSYVFVEIEGQPNNFRRLKVDIQQSTGRSFAVNAESFLKKSFKVISEGALTVNEVLSGGDKD